ncbi:type VI secretion system Vgr family protein [Planctomycetota bacterium]
MIRSQKFRNARMKTKLAKDTFLLHAMDGVDELSSMFQYDIEVLCEDFNIDLDDLLSSEVSVAVEMEGLDTRNFHGIIASISQDGAVGELARYRLTVRPWTWLLSNTADCKVFQKQSVPEIVATVFRDNNFSDFQNSLSGSYEKREYCVQYCESDLDFVNRLLESEGIYYFFEHTEKKHTLVLADAVGSHSSIGDPIPYSRESGSAKNFNHISDWNIARSVCPGKVVLSDFDFEKPMADLTSDANHDRKYKQSKFEYFDFPGGYTATAQGDVQATSRMEELQAEFDRASGSGCVLMMSVGKLFELECFPRKDQNREYLVRSARYHVAADGYQAGGGSGEPFQCSFSVIPSDQTFRPRRKTPRPQISGLQTAVIVGKNGEEIWTDKFGRVKVQFHWDRYGKSNEDSSCWVRVAQTWAGKGWGALQIPRIGQEVIVEFLNGDPDHPIVTGSVYNGNHQPPVELPDGATVSGLKTRSTKNGNAKTGNELLFEDKKDEEQIYFHAEKDFLRVVENNDSLKVGFDGKDSGDQTIEIYNDQKITIANGDRTVELTKGSEKFTVAEGDQTVEVTAGKQSTNVGKDYELKIGAKGVIEATSSLELKVGGSSIKIEPAKITLKATEIAIAADMKLESKATMISENASAQLQLKGGIVQIN